VKRQLVFHPPLAASLPVLLLLSGNMTVTVPRFVIRPLLTVLAVTIVVWGLLSLIFRSAAKAGLLVTVLVVLFFSYQPITRATNHVYLAHQAITLHRAILLLQVVLLGALVCFLARTRSHLPDLTRVLNIAAACLVAVPVANIAYHQATRAEARAPGSVGGAAGPAREGMPDVFYIILDAYGRADILKTIYGYDNSNFLDQLRQRGFRVCARAHSNYSGTILSLSSSLNCCYLDEVAREVGTETRDKVALYRMLRDNRVVASLRPRGYRFVAFATGYSLTEMPDADLYIRPSRYLNELEQNLVVQTPLMNLLYRLPGSLAGGLVEPYRLHRARVHFILDKLPELRGRTYPVFVFAHVLAPHPPFVFGRNGEPVRPEREFTMVDGSEFIKVGGTREEYIRGYRDQVAFISQKVLAAVDGILAASPEPPIIILQGDHGPGSHVDFDDPHNTNFKERLSILNALCVPSELSGEFYDDISPVNTFRIILGYLLDTDYELLEDRSYFSTREHPYDFHDVTAQVCD